MMASNGGGAASTGPKQMLQPERIRSACALLTIETLRDLLSHSRHYEAAQLYYARREQLVAHIEREVLATGALELIVQLGRPNIEAWLKELDVDEEELGPQRSNLYDMRQALYQIIEGTPLAFIGILGEKVLRNVSAELRLDALAPKDELRGMIKDEMQLLGLETFLGRLLPEQLRRLWQEWGLEPPLDAVPEDKAPIVERLVMWVFDIEPAEDGSVVEEGEEVEEEGEGEVEPTREEEMEEEAEEKEEEEGGEPDQTREEEMEVEAEEKEEEEEEGGAEEDQSQDLGDALQPEHEKEQQTEQTKEESEEDDLGDLEDLPAAADVSMSLIAGTVSQYSVSLDRSHEENVNEISKEDLGDISNIEAQPLETEKEEVQSDEEDTPNPFQHGEAEIQEVIISIDEGNGEDDENEEVDKPVDEGALVLSVEEDEGIEKQEVKAVEEKTEEEPEKTDVAEAMAEDIKSQVQQEKGEEEEKKDEPGQMTEIPAAAANQPDQDQSQAHKEAEEEGEDKTEPASVPSTPSRRGRLLSNINDIKPGLTSEDLEAFTNTVLREYCKENGLPRSRRKGENISTILAHWGTPEADLAEGTRKRRREEGENPSESESELDYSESETETSASEQENEDGNLTPRRRIAKRRRRATDIIDLVTTPGSAASVVRRSARRSVASSSSSKGH